MRYKIRTVTPVTTIPLPFPLAEALQHLMLQDMAGDAPTEARVEGLLRVAVDHVERFTGQVLSPRSMELVLDEFPVDSDMITMPREPVTEVSSIEYTDGDGATVTLDASDWRWSDSAAELLRPAFGTVWPTAASERASVRIGFEAGYEESLAPASLIGAVKVLLTHLYEDGGMVGNEMPVDARRLCMPYRCGVLV